MFKKFKIMASVVVTGTLVMVQPVLENAYAGTSYQSKQVLNDVSRSLKSSVRGLDARTVQGIMLTHYKTMRLVDENYQWVAPELEDIAAELLPASTTANDAIALVNKMEAVVKRNPYMMAFFHEAAYKNFETLEAKVESEGAQILPAVVAYAMVQENLTKAMYNDPNLIEVLKNIWVPTRQKLGIEANLSTFHRLKLMSVEKPMTDYIEFHSTGEVPADYGKLDLPLNIFEATAEDLAADRRDNAKSGAILAFNLPGVLPSRFAEDGKGIKMTMPAPKAWADLYTIWNMAFVSHFEYFPFVMVKLMIPQVNNYANEPELYMYNRSLALYSHLHFSFFSQFDQLVAGQPGMKWYDEDLTELFGQVSKLSAYDYKWEVYYSNGYSYDDE
ncbi:hypothetical protein [Agaribacterium haliotis]|uniref:hypothetical protein n=1 Tax=Agaribacterium haliotis TaxID=2013869 RepID=UPI000BB57639|nr:hypothetical protein [Agaribacterium haliotis]